MKLNHWIKTQLTSSRKSEAAWLDLVGSIATAIEAHIEEYLDKLKVRQSLYEMDKESLLEEFKELREIFPLGNVSDENLPHVVMQRQDEIHFKKMLYPLLATMRREFMGMAIKWERIYAPVNQVDYPYGELLIHESELEYSGFTKDELFLTSRGAILIPMSAIYELGLDIEQLEETIRKVVYPLIPLRIVLDGQLYVIDFKVTDLIETVSISSEITEAVSIQDDLTLTAEIKNQTVLHSTGLAEESPVDAVYGAPRMGAMPIDVLPLDRVYY